LTFDLARGVGVDPVDLDDDVSVSTGDDSECFMSVVSDEVSDLTLNRLMSLLLALHMMIMIEVVSYGF